MLNGRIGSKANQSLGFFESNLRSYSFTEKKNSKAKGTENKKDFIVFTKKDNSIYPLFTMNPKKIRRVKTESAR